MTRFFTSFCSQFDKSDKEHGSFVGDNLMWHGCLQFAKKNISYKLQATCKLGLFKSYLLPLEMLILLCFGIKSLDEEPREVSEKSNTIGDWLPSPS